MRFSSPVAEILTRLTSHNGGIPQGAPTSSDLANLVFWEKESRLVNRLSARGLYYTRLVDDICISSDEALPQDWIRRAIGQVRHFVLDYGLRVKNRKTQVAFAGSRQLVNGLLVNQRVSMPQEKRRAVRAAVHHMLRHEIADGVGDADPGLDSIPRLAGRLSNLAQFHPREAEKYRLKLGRG
jgi:retron-type reverse transcriptase